MLKSELQQLELLIGEIVNYNETAAPEILLKDVRNTLPRIKEACGQLRLKLVHELFSNVRETVILRYVQFHQAGIISLSDHVSISFPPAGDGAYPILAEVADHLEGVLYFLQSSFYKYFDPDHAVSAYQCQRETDQLARTLSGLVTELQAAGIDDSLIRVVNRSVTDQLQSARSSGISYQEIAYLKRTLGLIREHLNSEALNTESLAALLYQQNFNSHYFERWYHDRVNALLATAVIKEQAGLIQTELARLQDQYIDLGRSFDKVRPSLDLSFNGWLLLRQGSEEEGAGHARRGTAAPTRMPLNFSVAQFALFIRLCYMEGCFNLNNISSIHRFFTNHFETKKQLHISAKSFGRAFYGADQAAAAVVRDVLLRMVGTINKTYFPKI